MIDRGAGPPDGSRRRRRPLPRPRRRRPSGLVWLLVALAVVSGGVTYGLYRVLARDSLEEYDALQARGVRVSGTVVRVTPTSRVLPFAGPDGTVVYRFSAGDKVFEGRGGSAPPNPPSARLGPAAVVQVTYDRTDPASSCLCDPGRLARRTRVSMVVVAGATAVGVPLVGGLAAAFVGRGRRRDE